MFQPLDLTVNKFAKNFAKQRFSEWFSRQIDIGLGNGQELDNIHIDYKLSNLKALHAKWLIDVYNLMSVMEIEENIISGREKSVLHPAELESNRQKLIVDCIAGDEDAESDWEEQIEEDKAFDVFNEM